jgi:hypothetical protein
MTAENAELDQRFRQTGQIHGRRFDRELIVLDLGAGKYFSLDEVGSSVWEHLTNGLSLGEASQKIVDAYDVELETARRDVKRLASELVAAGLLETAG